MANSAIVWNYQGTDLKELSAGWVSTQTTVENNSANWDSSYNSISTLVPYDGAVRSVDLGSQNLSANSAYMSGNVGIGTSTPNERLTVNGNISASGNITALNLSGINTGDQDLSTINSQITTMGSVSANWNSTYTTVQSNSATMWNYQGTDLKALSGNWQSAYNSISNLVPYNGATSNVNLGNHDLRVDGNITINGADDGSGTKLQVNGGVKTEYIAGKQVNANPYNNPLFFRPVGADANWAFGSFADDNTGIYVMQARYYDVGDGNRGFRVEDYNTGNIPFLTNNSRTDILGNMLIGGTTRKTYFGVPFQVEIQFGGPSDGYSCPLGFFNNNPAGGDFIFTSFADNIAVALAGDVMIENDHGGMIFAPVGDIRFTSNGGWTAAPQLRINRNDANIILCENGGNVLVNTTIDDTVNKLQVNGSVNATGYYANGTPPVADGTYTMGFGATQNGTITVVGGIITAITEAIN